MYIKENISVLAGAFAVWFQLFCHCTIPDFSRVLLSTYTPDTACLMAVRAQKKWIVMQSGVSLHHDPRMKYACSPVTRSNADFFHPLHIGIIRSVWRADTDLSNQNLWVLEQSQGYCIFGNCWKSRLFGKKNVHWTT